MIGAENLSPETVCKLKSVTKLESELDFELRFAAEVHPFMRSYPEPLGDRYRDIQGLLQEIAERSQKSGFKHQSYLDSILPIEQEGYSYALCSSGPYTKSKSGINIDPSTFPFRASAADNFTFFSHVDRDNYDYSDGTSLVSSEEGPLTENSAEDINKVTIEAQQNDTPELISDSRPESLIVNPAESAYQSLINSPESSLPLPTSENRAPVSNLSLHRDSEIATSRVIGIAPSERVIGVASSRVIMNALSEARDSALPRVPGPGLYDCNVYDSLSDERDKFKIVVSGDWLSGWMNKLREIEGMITLTTGKSIQRDP